MRRLARRPVEACEGNFARARRAVDFDTRIERQQGLGKVARVAGDALVADAKHRMRAIEAIERRAARAGNSLVAIGI